MIRINYLPEPNGKLLTFVTVAETFAEAIRNFTIETGFLDQNIYSINRM